MTTLSHLHNLKSQGEKFTMLTAYDATFAKLISELGVDVILVGDSLGMVIQGHDTTLNVTIDDILYHTRCVVRGNRGSLIMSDLPFASYHTIDQALTNAAKLFQAGCGIVKIEGGEWLCETIKALTERGMPVCAHIGLTPQFIHQLGGFKVQGRDQNSADNLISAAKKLQDAGASMLVLECVPHTLATTITQTLSTPVIGIGAGKGCDAQVLVTQDMLGLNGYQPFRFVKTFLNENNKSIGDAISGYIKEVKEGIFPAEEHQFT